MEIFQQSALLLFSMPCQHFQDQKVLAKDSGCIYMYNKHAGCVHTHTPGSL